MLFLMFILKNCYCVIDKTNYPFDHYIRIEVFYHLNQFIVHEWI